MTIVITDKKRSGITTKQNKKQLLLSLAISLPLLNPSSNLIGTNQHLEHIYQSKELSMC